MPFVVVRDTSACPVSKPWAVYTEQGHGTGKTTGQPHGCFPSAAAAREQQKALYANVPEAKSAAPPPPNLHEAEPTAAERCGSCHMFDAEKSACWGYGLFHVESHEVCDSFSPEPAAEEAKSMSTTSLAPHLVEWRRTRAHDLSESQRKRTETRQLHEPLELREATADGTRTLRSYASLFDEPYTVRAAGYRFEEIVKPGAFKRTLGTNPDVVFRYDHSGPPLARTSSGTLRLGEDKKGLWYEADLNPDDPDVKALIPKITRGDLSESSFAFRVGHNGDSWNDDHTLREVLACELDRGDVSVVTFGASRTTGKHMLLRSEEAIVALQEIGFERFMEAWVEWRNWTLLPNEKRVGRVVSSQTMETLRKVLELIADADDAVDEAEAMLSDFLDVPNPDLNGSSGDGKVTSAEQLGRVRSEERDHDSPLDSDRHRTAPHLMDTVLSDLAHAQQHIGQLFDSEVMANIDASQFNADHLKRHVDGAQEHAQKLDRHLSEFSSDPSVFRSEREKISAQRADAENKDKGETSEGQAKRDDADDAVNVALIRARDALHEAMEAQKADPDAKTDPNDAKVYSHLEDAKNAIDEAIVDQAMDEAYEDGAGRSEWGDVDLYDESDDRKALTSKARNSLPSEAFVYPKDRRYPIQDISHARNALARSSGKPEESEVKRAVYKRYPSLKPGNQRFELLPNDSEDLMDLLKLRGV